jgi:hypothetical protein
MVYMDNSTMGHLDQFVKTTFAEETEAVTGGAAAWVAPPEIGLTEVRGDGLLLVRDGLRLTQLEWPWPAALGFEEIFTELKMPGDHVDAPALQRALLRRQAWQVHRIEATEPVFLGEVPLWMTAPHVPEVLRKLREVQEVAAGCYRVHPASFDFLWIAANELPLREELIPFLVARSGRALVEFGRWVVRHRSPAWMLRMLQILPMPMSVQEEFLRYLPPTDDPEIEERGRNLARLMLKKYPDVRNEIVEEGSLKLLHDQAEHRLGRTLSTEERRVLNGRVAQLGANRIGNVVLDLSPEALAAWLADPEAT